MKRQTAMALAAVFAMSVAGTALAAPANPFVDVPAKHWAYDAINKLAQAGVISGYGDGTYQGNKTLTRYEVATIVAKAMANSDKADAATKREIEALKAEFGTELNNLGVRVDNLEKNSSKVKFKGEIRERYEYAKDVTAKDATAGQKTIDKTRFRLTMIAPIDNNVTFTGRFHSESEWGDGTNNTAKLDQAYISGKLGDSGVDYKFGRQPMFIGLKLLNGNSQNNDGLLLSAGKDVRVTVGSYKYQDSYTGKYGKVNRTYNMGDIDFKLNTNLHVTASYMADKDDQLFKSTAAGFKYTGLNNFTLSGEYGQNDSDLANSKNSGDAAKAWASRIKYRGANASKVNSYGLYVSYRKADPAFDVTNNQDFTDGADWNTYVNEMDNVKGLDYGFEYTVFKNGIMRIQYNDLTKKTDDTDRRNMFAELIYTF